ncbi:MAG: HPF/RaiA family ribosome-associated protein [Chthoniobacter sp.]|nr:HPF/RaiA family ribosome-associated protein [Chthoniobacter sp.]
MKTQTTPIPAQITFRNMLPSDAVATRIQEETDKLSKYFDRITSCSVIIEAPQKHHRHGEPFHIHIELCVPGKDLVVAHNPTRRAMLEQIDERPHKAHEIEAPHKDPYLAIHDGFRAMRRQLQDYVQLLRHEVKKHEG